MLAEVRHFYSDGRVESRPAEFGAGGASPDLGVGDNRTAHVFCLYWAFGFEVHLAAQLHLAL
jgi:hypothetical protein